VRDPRAAFGSPLAARIHRAWEALADRHRWLRGAARWALSIGSLLSGVFTLVVFRRGSEFFPWILGYLLLLWIGGVVFANVRRALEARDHRLMGAVVDYTIQGLHQDLLLFLLPIYYGSTTLSSRNAVFLVVLLMAALLTTIDPWYQGTVLRHPWMAHALFAFGLFASLNVGLPFVGVRSGWALILSAALSLLALAPVLRRHLAPSWHRASIWAAMCAVLAASAVWWVRDWIPPAPLHLSSATFARSVKDLTPIDPIRQVRASVLKTWGGVVCFTAVSAPAGLREPIHHVWSKNGSPSARVALSPIRGGRVGGYRTYSKRSDIGVDPTGQWTVDVVTAHEQLIGRVRLQVTP
jgi:hypothetical protein